MVSAPSNRELSLINIFDFAKCWGQIVIVTWKSARALYFPVYLEKHPLKRSSLPEGETMVPERYLNLRPASFVSRIGSFGRKLPQE
jgi:hypothetical protein